VLIAELYTSPVAYFFFFQISSANIFVFPLNRTENRIYSPTSYSPTGCQDEVAVVHKQQPRLVRQLSQVDQNGSKVSGNCRRCALVFGLAHDGHRSRSSHCGQLVVSHFLLILLIHSNYYFPEKFRIFVRNLNWVT
jgi:hypothetical protein